MRLFKDGADLSTLQLGGRKFEIGVVEYGFVIWFFELVHLRILLALRVHMLAYETSAATISLGE